MRHLLCVPDKFKGTADAGELAAAAAAAGRARGWSASALRISDGGEGLLDAVGGEAHVTEVTGPLGDRVRAEWRLLEGGPSGDGATAIIEMARASGLVLAGGVVDNRPLDATTRGVGELVVAALAAGARRIVIGCGGSATTDGGLGAVEAIGDAVAQHHARITVACDVTTPFCDAARVFGLQKGATTEQIVVLTRRLEKLATRYAEQFGVDVTTIERAGAAGGLAGGLAALGAALVSGFDLVAELVGLDGAIAGSDLVVTGEGRLDATSTSGKVVGEIARRCADGPPLWCLVGSVADDLDPAQLFGAHVVSLSARFGADRALSDPAGCFAAATGEALDAVEALIPDPSSGD